jgi:uncharacterized membrane protein
MGAVFVLIPPFNETFLKIPIALSLFFFVPGYAFISALFPGKKDISGIERFTLSVGFSLILTVFDGFLISLLPWGYHPPAIVISIIGITAFFSISALFTRKLLDEDEQFSFSLKELIKDLKSNGPEENSESTEKNELGDEELSSVEKRRFYRSRSKIRAEGLKHPDEKVKVKVKTKPLPPEIEKALVIALIGSIIIASGMLVYAKMTREKETLTMLYLLGPDGKAEGYPNESLIDVPLVVTVGIENHELQDVNYVLQMKVDDEVIREQNVFLEDGGTWQVDMNYTREKLKTDRSKLEFVLFKEKPDDLPYRTVHLYIENNNTIDHIDKQKYADVPTIENGEMESSTGWEFTSNTDRITGSYLNESGVNSSFAYRIENSYDGNLSNLPEYGEISQNIVCDGDTMVLLSAYLKSASNSSEGFGAQKKYVNVNGVTVWTEEVKGSEGWKHLIVPVSLHAGSNNLTLGLQQTYGEIKPVEIFWDDVSFESFADLSLYPLDSPTLEANLPVSTVQPLPAYTNSKTFIVFWNGTDDSGIAYYCIDASTDGVNWQNWILKTTDNSSVFTGEENQTYYFRSRAFDTSGNGEPVHSAPDTWTKIYTGTPTIMLDITPNPCKNATNITVSSTIPLSSVVCHVSRDGFTPDSSELTSSDGITWTGGYVINNGNHFYVEVVCTDSYGKQKSIFDEIIVDNSLPNFKIQATPRTIDSGDLDIKVTSSVALKYEPSVSISGIDDGEIIYFGYSGDEYLYKARIKSDIDEGEYFIYVAGDGLDSEIVEGNTTFIVDHAD